MPHFNVLVLMGGLAGYLVSILVSTALVLLFFRFNQHMLPGQKVTVRVIGASGDHRLAPVIALGAATLCQAFLLRHAVFTVMAMVQDFLIVNEGRILAGQFPFAAFWRLVGLSLLVLAFLSLLAAVSIWLAGAFFNWMTRGVDETQEIANGNVSMAVLFAFVLLAITVLLNEGIEDISRALIPYGRPGVVRLS